MLRRIFKLPDPVALIKVLNDREAGLMENAVKACYEDWLFKHGEK